MGSELSPDISPMRTSTKKLEKIKLKEWSSKDVRAWITSRSLRNCIGDKKLSKILRKYFSKCVGKNLLDRNFNSIMKKHLQSKDVSDLDISNFEIMLVHLQQRKRFDDEGWYKVYQKKKKNATTASELKECKNFADVNGIEGTFVTTYLSEDVFPNDSKDPISINVKWALVDKWNPSPAIIVGPYFMEWCEDGFVYVRKRDSRLPLIAHDVASIDNLTFDEYAEVLKKVLIVALVWNVNYNYDAFERNSRHFVNEVLKELGLKTNDVLRRNMRRLYYEKIKEVNVTFCPSKEFMFFFGLRKKEYEFPTHEKLDEWVKDILTKSNFKSIEELNEKFKDDMMFLKCLDRGFWLRHLDDIQIEKNKPRLSTTGWFSDCPFGDPEQTKSFQKWNQHNLQDDEN